MATESVPRGIRLLSYARAMRYVGWGFGESLIPVFIMGLAGSYAAAGLIRSIYDISFLLVIPVLGLLVERRAAKGLVIAGLILYPFVGVFYVLAGITGMTAFIVAARAMNGLTYGLDTTGIDTYFRRMNTAEKLGSSFGFMDMVSNIGWVLAAIAGIWLVKWFTIPQLLLLIAPFSLLAIPFVLKARTDHPSLGRGKRVVPLHHAYRAALEEWTKWGVELQLLAFLLLFIEAVNILIEFFVPIEIFQKSANLSLVIIFTVVEALPSIFGYVLGRFADSRDKRQLVILGCAAIGLILFIAALPLPYLLVVAGGLILGTLLELLSLLQKSLATGLAPAEHWGRLDSVFATFSGIGDLALPAILGIALDLIGFPLLASVMGAIAFLVALVFMGVSKRRLTLRGLPLFPVAIPPHGNEA